MKSEHRLLKRISITCRGKSNFYPLLGSIAVVGIFLFVLRRWGAALSRSTEVAIGLLGLLISLLVFQQIQRITRRNLRQTAEELDQQLDAHNQLEAMIELKDTRHPLRIPQQQRAERELQQYKPAPWMFLLTLAALLLCVELAGYTQQLCHIGWWGGSVPALEELDVPPEMPAKDEFAELKLTKPESEIRLKPMDEVVWEGVGRSSNGFEDLHLAVFLNGNPVVNIPVEGDALDESGEIKMAGAFFLDELDATPYDVVSYHLYAQSEINGHASRKIVSIPQFVEVRPFREDAAILQGMDMDMDMPPGEEGERAKMISILGTIHQVLEFELILNKALFAVRSSGFADDDPVVLEQIGLLKQEQKQLSDTLATFLASIDPERLTPNMIVSLRTAEEHMAAAAQKLDLFSSDDVERGSETL